MKATLRRLALASLVFGFIGCGSDQSSDAKKDAAADLAQAKDAGVRDLAPSPDVQTPEAALPDLGLSDAATATDGGVDAGTPGDATADAGSIDLPADAATTDATATDAALPKDTVPGDTLPKDTTAAPDAATTVDAAVAADTSTRLSCEYPTCLQDLQRNCVPTGACTQQFDLTTFSTATCYDNGVKFSTKVDIATMGSEIQWKNPSGICYSVRTANASALGADLTWLNPAGSVVATAREDFNAMTIAITCAGQAPVTISLNCGADGGTASDAGVCASGTCAF